jgi:peptide/nickel transport system substrate-binding protein
MAALASLLGLLLFAAGANAGDNNDTDIIRIASPYRTTTLDPIRSVFTGSIETFGQLYSRLLRRDGAGNLQPGLAERWEVSGNGKVYTFQLRAARFSDGSPITAQDVAFSLLRMRDHPEAAYSASVSNVASASAIGRHTLQVTLEEPSTPFLEALDMCFLGVVSKQDVERRGEQAAFSDQPVTSGPYRVRQWNRNDRLILEANPHYWRQGFPRNSGAELIEVVDVNTRIAMLLAGEVDAVRAIPWSQVRTLQGEDSVNIPHEPATAIWIILLNHDRPPFNDIRVRQAAALALDRELITRTVTRGIAKMANTTLPSTLRFHHDAFTGWPFDLDRARRLMSQTNASGQEVIINLTAPDAAGELLAVILQSQWAKIGLQVRIVKMDQALEEQNLEAGEYDASLNWWYNENLDPDLAVKWAVCGSCGNRSFYTNYQNDEVDRLVAGGALTADPDKRRAIYHQIQEISTREVAQIPLFYPPWLNAYRNDIEGLTLTPNTQWTLENARHY